MCTCVTSSAVSLQLHRCYLSTRYSQPNISPTKDCKTIYNRLSRIDKKNPQRIRSGNAIEGNEHPPDGVLIYTTAAYDKIE